MGLLKLAPWQDTQAPLASSAATSAGGLHGQRFGRGGGVALLRVVGRQVGDVLVAQRAGHGVHGAVLALALLVFVQCRDDVLGVLARDHRHLVHFGKARLVAGDAVAADALGVDLLPGCGIALERPAPGPVAMWRTRPASTSALFSSSGNRQLHEGWHVKGEPHGSPSGSSKIIRPALILKRLGSQPVSARPPLSATLLLATMARRGTLHRTVQTTPMKFQGTDNYIATPDLMLAVNAAVTLEAPAAGQGRARHRQDHAGRGSRQRDGACRCCSGTSRAPPRRSRACTNTTR